MQKIKLDLSKIGGQLVKTKENKLVVVLPFDERYMFKGKKGLYVDLISFEKQTEFSDGYIKPSASKEIRDKLEANGKQLPIVGNYNILKQNPEPDKTDFEIPDNQIVDEKDDLPF